MSPKIAFAIFLLIALSWTTEAQQPSIRDQVRAMISAQSVAFPGGVFCNNCLLNKWTKQTSEAKNAVFAVKDMDSALQSYPAKLREKAQMLRFGVSAKTSFEDFHMEVGPNGVAVRKSYIGAARRNGPNIELGMVAAEVVGQLVPKFNILSRRTCKKVLWVFKSCKTRKFSERRGLQAAEIQSIEVALRSETARLWAEKVNQLTV